MDGQARSIGELVMIAAFILLPFILGGGAFLLKYDV
jgi:type IV secretory pathway TrbL component